MGAIRATRREQRFIKKITQGPTNNWQSNLYTKACNAIVARVMRCLLLTQN